MNQARLLTFVLLLFFVPVARAQWVNGQDAYGVIGQSNFMSNTNATSSTGIGGALMMIVDTAAGKVFVADYGNNRILRFSSLTAAAAGSSAEVVFGQTSFTTKVAATTQSGLNHPYSISIDSAGNLWVADYTNNRVIRYPGADTVTTSGEAANLVLGQSNFTTLTIGTASNKLHSPVSVQVSGNSLWVTDRLNDRVLRFDNIDTMHTNGDPAIVQLGITGTAAASQNTFSGPWQVFVDASNIYGYPTFPITEYLNLLMQQL
jgi:streptogramin lyase